MSAEILPFRAQDAPGQVTISELVALYVERRLPLLGEETQVVRRRYLDAFTRDCGHWVAADRCADDLERWLQDKAERWPSNETRYSAFASVNAVMNWAVLKARKIQANPFRGAEQERGDARRAMRDDEFRALLRHTTAHFRRVLFFLWWTGCRPCELRRLRWDMIDAVKGVVAWQKHKTRKKTRKPRIVRLTPRLSGLLAFILREQLAAGLESDLVFLNSRGGQWLKNTLVTKIDRLRKVAGVEKECKLYCTRHAFATDAAVRGLTALELAELMGHTGTRTLERFYVHLGAAEEHMQSAAGRAIEGK